MIDYLYRLFRNTLIIKIMKTSNSVTNKTTSSKFLNKAAAFSPVHEKRNLLISENRRCLLDKAQTLEEKAFTFINSKPSDRAKAKFVSTFENYKMDLLVPNTEPPKPQLTSGYDFKQHYLNDPEYENKMSKRAPGGGSLLNVEKKQKERK